MADRTANETEQVTPAPMPAPLTAKLTAFAAIVVGNPVQVAPPATATAPPVATRFVGNVSVNATLDKACAALGFVTAMVNVELVFCCTAIGLNDFAIVGRESNVAVATAAFRILSLDVTPPTAMVFV